MSGTLYTVVRVVKDLGDALLNQRTRAGAKVFLAGMKRDVREAFAQAIDPVTREPWPKGKKKTGRTLIATGDLMRAAERAVDSAVPSGWGVTVKLTNPEYGFFHQNGTGRNPRRRFFGVGPVTVKETREQTVKEVVKVIVTAGDK